MRIMVAGSGRLGVSVLEPLLESHHQVVALLQNGRATRGFMRRLVPLQAHLTLSGANLIPMAARNRIPILWIDKMTHEALSPIRDLEPDLIIACGFSIIFKRSLLELPATGCINVHSSLLPRHRGPMPFGHVVLAGEKESGVTIHIMEEGIDTGDILDQATFPLDAADTALTVYYKSCESARALIRGVVDAIETGGLKGTPQDESQASYDKRLGPDDVTIQWDLPAQDLERMVRAGTPFCYARFKHRGRTIRIGRAGHDSTTIEAEPGTVLARKPWVRVATGRGALIIRVAYTSFPFPSVWPAPWNKPRIGETLT